MGVGKSLGAKLFIEGKEVPFIGATITSAVGQASIAYIDVVPHASINNIKPRTFVSIHVRDTNNAKASEPFPYVLAWEGEVFGYSFSKSPGSRTFSLTCIDFSSYWDNVLTYFLNPTTSLGKGGQEMLAVGLDGYTSEKSGFKTVATQDSIDSYLYQTMRDKGQKDFLEGFVSVYKSISNINKFYQNAENRLRISDRILLKSSGKLTELLEQNQAFKWFQGIAGKTGGGFASLRMVIQDLMSVIFHDFTAIPFPARVEKADLPKDRPTVPADSDRKKFTIGQFIFKPNLYMIPPPMCNIFFPDEYSNFQFSRNFFKEPTRLIYKPQLPTYLQQSGNIAMPYRFEPDSLQAFMMGKDGLKGHIGSDEFQVPEDQGFFGETDKDPNSSKTNNGLKREGQFTTNEEMMKGIWMAQESMFPAATNFAKDVNDPAKDNFVRQIARYMFYKKRFENRSLQITSHLKLSVVPGFNILLLDDSDSNQSTLAYCSSVTHRIYATEGGYTNVQLSYARTVGEEREASKNGNDPVVPPWFDQEVFGAVEKPPSSAAGKEEVSSKGTTYVGGPKLSEYYAALLGGKGSAAITNYFKNEPTIIGATLKLIDEYKKKKQLGNEAVQTFISDITDRDYIRTRDAFTFLGASLEKDELSATTSLKTDKVKGTDLRQSFFNVFKGGAFNESDKDYGSTLKVRLSVIDEYQSALKNFRGFRG